MRVRDGSRRRPLLAVVAAVAGVACVAAPFLLWLGRGGETVACGWTCYVPLDPDHPLHWAREAGRTGFGVEPGLGAVLVAAGVAALTSAALLGRRRAVPARLGWALGLLGVAALAWSLTVVLSRTVGDTWVLVAHGDAFQPSTGPGAWAALVGAAAVVGLAATLVGRRRRERLDS